MIDNFRTLENILRFEKDHFYILQILRRKKDDPFHIQEDGIIKHYFVYSQEYLRKKESDIKAICDTLNARAYINLNKTTYKKSIFNLNIALAKALLEGKFNTFNNMPSSVAFKSPIERRLWVIDLETLNQEDIYAIEHEITNCNSVPLDEIGEREYHYIKTVNGYHLLTTPFNLNQFDSRKDVDIHKNGLTLLYAK